MGDSELATDVAGPNSLLGELHNPLSDHIWQGAAIDKETPELIDAAMTWKEMTINQWLNLSIELILTL